jgi:large subunit ribosomal protein L18
MAIMDKKQARLRRARKTRAKLSELKAARLAVHRSNCHIYAQIFSGCGTKVLASASTLEAEVRTQVQNGGNAAAASFVGKLIAERAKAVGVEQVAFDRCGFHYHGRVKALAEAARESGLKF